MVNIPPISGDDWGMVYGIVLTHITVRRNYGQSVDSRASETGHFHSYVNYEGINPIRKYWGCSYWGWSIYIADCTTFTANHHTSVTEVDV